MNAHLLALDANLLLLYTVGSYEPRTLGSYKRLSVFTADDLRFLQLVLRRRKLVTTPHLFTEVCNLANGLPEATRQGFFRYLIRFIPNCVEQVDPSMKVASSPAFAFFGMTDAALGLLAKETLVVTEDGRLRDYLLRAKLHATSLNALRQLYLSRNMVDL